MQTTALITYLVMSNLAAAAEVIAVVRLKIEFVC